MKSDKMIPSIQKLNKHGAKVRLIFLSVDFITSNIAFFLFNILRYYFLNESISFGSLSSFICDDKLIIEQIFFPCLIISIYGISGFYNYVIEKSRAQELISSFFCSLINSLIIFFTLLIDDRASILKANYFLLLSLFLTLWILTYVGRLIVITWNLYYMRRHQFSNNILCIVKGKTTRIKSLIKKMANRAIGNKIIGIIDLDGKNRCELESIDRVCIQKNINQIIISEEAISEDLVTFILEKSFPLEISVKILNSKSSFFSSRIKTNDVLSEPLIDLTVSPLGAMSFNVKRISDVMISSVSLILLIPVYIIIAVFVKLSSPGKVFYVQKRVGRKMKPFNIIKFRTMYENSEPNGPQLSSSEDNRITPIGKFLRKYRLDEFPQFWNVLKGDMSIVGPRPERSFYVSQIIKQSPYYSLIFQIRPGITSWGMVKFGYASNVEEMVERSRYDILYLGNMSMITDIKIVFYTINTLLTGKGV